MEVVIDSIDTLPHDSFISIRAGGTRRQAAVAALKNHKLKFPKMCSSSEPLKLDVLRPIYRGSLILVPNQEAYQIFFDTKDGANVECSMKVKAMLIPEPGSADDSTLPNAEPASQAPVQSGQYRDTVKQAQGYLEKTKLLEFLQGLLQETIKDKPKDPVRHIWSLVGRSLSENTENISTDAAWLQEVTRLKEELAIARSTPQASDEDKRRLEEAMAELKRSEELRKQLEKSTRDLAARIEAKAKGGAEEAAEKLKEDSNAMDKGKVEELTKVIDDAEKNAANLQKTVDELKERVDKLTLEKASADEAEKQVAELQKTVARLEADNKALAEKQAASIDEKKLQADEEAKRTNQGEQVSADKLKKALQDLAQAEKRRTELEEKVKSLADRMAQVKAENEKADSLQDAATGIVASSTKKLEEAEGREEKLRQSVESLRREMQQANTADGRLIQDNAAEDESRKVAVRQKLETEAKESAVVVAPAAPGPRAASKEQKLQDNAQLQAPANPEPQPLEKAANKAVSPAAPAAKAPPVGVAPGPRTASKEQTPQDNAQLQAPANPEPQPLEKAANEAVSPAAPAAKAPPAGVAPGPRTASKEQTAQEDAELQAPANQESGSMSDARTVGVTVSPSAVSEQKPTSDELKSEPVEDQQTEASTSAEAEKDQSSADDGETKKLLLQGFEQAIQNGDLEKILGDIDTAEQQEKLKAALASAINQKIQSGDMARLLEEATQDAKPLP